MSKDQIYILVVDDNRMMQQAVSRILKSKTNYNPILADCGQDALRLAKNRQPNLILLDIMMPGMDGFEVCRKLKEDPETEQIPIIFLSGMSDTRDIVNGLQEGAVDYITKPIKTGELLARLETHLNMHFLKQELKTSRDQYQGLLHFICHDLSNYLSYIHGASQIARSEQKASMETIDDVFEGSSMAIQILNRVREYDATNTGKLSVDLSDENLSDMIQESLQILKDKWEPKEIEIVVDELDADCKITVEREWFILSILNNLLTNAIKFSHKSSKVILKSWIEEDLVHLQIQDFGIGVPPESMPHLFSTTHKTNQLGTLGEHGTGFGMPLVKSWVTTFGGTVTVASKFHDEFPEDHGTIVKMTFPKV